MGDVADSRLRAAGRWISVPVLVFGLAGCESWLNPHVAPEMEPPSLSADGTTVVETTKNGTPTTEIRKSAYAGAMEDAIKYANAWRQRYYKSVGEQSKLKNGVSLSLVPLSAAALFLGITSETGASRDAIAGLGIGGAALFAAGTLAHNATYQQIYLAGSRAVGCAVVAARPLLVKREDYKVLQDALAALRTGDGSISDVEKEIHAVRLAAKKLREVAGNAAAGGRRRDPGRGSGESRCPRGNGGGTGPTVSIPDRAGSHDHCPGRSQYP